MIKLVLISSVSTTCKMVSQSAYLLVCTFWTLSLREKCWIIMPPETLRDKLLPSAKPGKRSVPHFQGGITELLHDKKETNSKKERAFVFRSPKPVFVFMSGALSHFPNFFPGKKDPLMCALQNYLPSSDFPFCRKSCTFSEWTERLGKYELTKFFERNTFDLQNYPP